MTQRKKKYKNRFQIPYSYIWNREIKFRCNISCFLGTLFRVVSARKNNQWFSNFHPRKILQKHSQITKPGTRLFRESLVTYGEKIRKICSAITKICRKRCGSAGENPKARKPRSKFVSTGRNFWLMLAEILKWNHAYFLTNTIKWHWRCVIFLIDYLPFTL